MKILIALLCLQILCVVSANADRVETQFLVGALSPHTKIALIGSDDLASKGISVGARIMADISPIFSVGPEIQFLTPTKHESVSLVPNANTSSSFESMLLLGSIRIKRPEGAVRPFGIAGTGFHTTRMQIESTPRSGFVWSDTGTRETRKAIDSKSTSMAASLQAGLDFQINDSLQAGVSLAWYYLGYTLYDSTPAAQSLVPGFVGVDGPISATSLAANINFRF